MNNNLFKDMMKKAEEKELSKKQVKGIFSKDSAKNKETWLGVTGIAIVVAGILLVRYWEKKDAYLIYQ